MMLTVAENINVFYNDKITVFRRKCQIFFKGLVKHLCNFVIGIIHSLEHFFVHPCHTIRGIFESLTIRIISQSDQQSTDMLTHCVFIYCHNLRLLSVITSIPDILHATHFAVPDDLVHLKLHVNIVHAVIFHKVYDIFQFNLSIYRA